jgi:hypothetical protein
MGLNPVNAAMNSAVNDQAELCRWGGAAQHRKSVAKALQKHRRAMQGSTAALISIIFPIFIII